MFAKRDAVDHHISHVPVHSPLIGAQLLQEDGLDCNDRDDAHGQSRNRSSLVAHDPPVDRDVVRAKDDRELAPLEALEVGLDPTDRESGHDRTEDGTACWLQAADRKLLQRHGSIGK